MNTNNGNDPMLCSFICDDWNKFLLSSSSSPSPIPPLTLSIQSNHAFTLPMEGLLSPEANSSFTDLALLWSSERKRVPSIKPEDDDAFTASPCTASDGVDSADIDMEEIDIGSNTTMTEVKSEVEDPEYDIPAVGSMDTHEFSDTCKREYHMSDFEARKFVEEQFEKIAFVPSSKLSQRDKIAYILAKSDCKDFSVDTVLNFDKKSADSARACAKIVQNIPQRYRWECVKPEDIVCCYTIVADCKKVSSRDKPPRPMNAFMIWAQGARRLINELCPKMQNALISEALGYCWRQKSDAFKKRFEQEKIKLRRFHNVEFPEYKYKPKTKVQKAKEKQELSLTKAKMRASVKREKQQQAQEANLYRRRTAAKSGRPRKTKPVNENKEGKESPSLSMSCNTPVRMSPTSPAIKDMLTLKILSDRRSKGDIVSPSKSRETVHSALGQLSPLEVGSPGVGDIFDELGNLETMVASHHHHDKGGKAVHSSVYDTPANTPPLDSDEEMNLSPMQHHPALLASPPLSLPSTTKSKMVMLSYANSAAATATPKQMLMPSLSAMLSSPTKTTSCSVSNQNRPVIGYIAKPVSVVNKLLPAMVEKQAEPMSELTKSHLRRVTQIPPVSQSLNNVSRVKDGNNNIGTAIDANNNASDINNNNNNNHHDDNNNVGPPPSYAVSVLNSKLNNPVSEFTDLDFLSLDLFPLLSDDDMRSILKTL